MRGPCSARKTKEWVAASMRIYSACRRRSAGWRDPAIVLLAKIVNGADTDNTLWNQPGAAWLNAIVEGLRHLSFQNDHEIIAAESIVYGALYGYCQKMVTCGKVDGQFH